MRRPGRTSPLQVRFSPLALGRGVAWPWGRIVFAAAGLLIAVAPLPASSAPPAERHIRLQAADFEFSPSVVQVNLGDTVTLELVAADVVHGLFLDGYGLWLTADPGQPDRVTFVADRPGAFVFRCSVACGPLHPFMVGRLQVGPNTLLWRAAGLATLVAAAGLWRNHRWPART